MSIRNTFTTLLLALGLSGSALAAEPLKIGLVLPLSGPFAAYGKQIEHGVRLYLQQHGQSIAGRPVEMVLRDDTGTDPELARQAARELTGKEKVHILAGFGLTPAAMAAAPVATETRTPMVVMNAASSSVTSKSPYIVRTSMSLPQITAPMASWAAKGNLRKVYTLVADYGPGLDAQAQFKATFTAAGGSVVGEARTSPKGADYGPYLDQIAKTQPEAVFIFLPPGAQTIAFMKAFNERGLMRDGIRLFSTGDLTDEDVLDNLGDAAMGMITSFHYAETHDSPENQAFTTAYYKAFPKDRPNFMAVGGYDGMTLIARALEKTGGSAEAERFIDAARGQQWISPRGPVSIDPNTRDIVQNVYIRGVARLKGKLQNIEFDQVASFRDPAKP